MLTTALASLRTGWAGGLRPDEPMTVSEFADKFRLLNTKSSPEGGRWRTARVPFMRDIMDDLSQFSDVEIVSLMKCTQIGATEILNNWLASIVALTPGPAMMVQPTVDLARRWSLQRWAPMVEDMPVLSEKIKPSRSRDSGNTVLSKDYDGGLLVLTGANSAPGLCSMPVKYLGMDEIDRYPYDVGEDGDPGDVAIERTGNFSRRKIFIPSSPTIKDLSRIEKLYKEGDQRRCFLPCPECKEKQVLEFKNLKWKKDAEGNHLPDTVKLACVHCGSLIGEHNKTWMLENYEWRVTGKPNNIHHSYHINRLYAPLGWSSWADLVRKFLKAKDDELKLKTFTNTTEGLPFELKANRIDHVGLKARAEDYPLRVVPMGGLILLAGVDTQDDRLEVTVWAEGARMHTWAIDYHVIYGSPALQSTWKELDDYLAAPFPHAAGCELTIKAVAVDSGGHHTQEVYDYCRIRKARGIFATKGYSQSGRPIIGKPSAVDVTVKGKTIKGGGELWMVGADTAKSQIYSRLAIDDPVVDGYVHLSKHLPESFFKQIASEKQDTQYRKGFPHLVWVLPPGTRNEVLDCTVGAKAASYKLGLHRWRPAQWRQLEEKVQPATPDLFAASGAAEQAEQVEAVAPVKTSVKKKKRVRRPRSGGFVRRGIDG